MLYSSREAIDIVLDNLQEEGAYIQQASLACKAMNRLSIKNQNPENAEQATDGVKRFDTKGRTRRYQNAVQEKG